MDNGDKRFRGPRCKATTKAGKPCGAIASTDGLCAIHGGRVDPREMGRRGGSVGKGGAVRREAIRNNPSLRDFLRENVEPAAVWAAITAALEGSSEAARVSASKLLIDSLHEPERERERQTWIDDAAREFDRKFAYRLERQRQIEQGRLVEILEPLGLAHLAEEDEIKMVRELARRLAGIPAAIRAEHDARETSSVGDTPPPSP
jgi:hypothetical protein